MALANDERVIRPKNISFLPVLLGMLVISNNALADTSASVNQAETTAAVNQIDSSKRIQASIQPVDNLGTEFDLTSAVPGSEIPDYQIAQASEWVVPVELPNKKQLPKSSISAGVYYVLVDTQTKVAGKDTENYYRYSRQFINKSGVENSSAINITFDPNYQTLVLHKVDLIRDGKVINKLTRQAVKLLQRENDLERLMYDGRWTADIVIEDIRENDTLDYAFTIKGRNPVLGERYASGFDVEWGVPVGRIHTVIAVPESQTLHVKKFNTDIDYKLDSHPKLSGHKRYEWNKDDAKSLEVDADLPRWYFPWGWVQVSQFDSWQAVSEWAKPLYVVTEEPSPAYKQLLEKIKSKKTAEAQLTEAVRWVQEDIRYLGIELLEGSHRPRPPNTVLERRYGDCKDKSLLLTALFRDLGYEAYPALVHNSAGKVLTEKLPSSTTFNHVITLLVKDGKHIWVDPTLTNQGGDIDTYAGLTYAHALPIETVINRAANHSASHSATHSAPKNIENSPLLYSDLQVITEPLASQNVLEVKEYFEIKDYSNPVSLIVKSTFLGSQANAMRSRLANSSLDKIAKAYLNSYAYYYTDMVANKDLVVKDDVLNNRIEVQESYSITDFWLPDDDNEEKLIATFYPIDIGSRTTYPKSRIRTMPLAIASRRSMVRQYTEVKLPKRKWSFKDESKEYKSKAIDYRGQLSYKNQLLKMNYILRKEETSLSAQEAKKHIRTLKKIRNQLGYNIFKWPDSDESEKKTP